MDFFEGDEGACLAVAAFEDLILSVLGCGDLMWQVSTYSSIRPLTQLLQLLETARVAFVHDLYLPPAASKRPHTDIAI
jgi:hypothetical protein